MSMKVTCGEFVGLAYASDDELREFAEEILAENAKLRELVRQWYPHMLKRVGRDALEQWGQMEAVRELGIEVIDD